MLGAELLAAVGAKDQAGVEACARRLRQLDADTFDDEPDNEPLVPFRPLPPVMPVVPFVPFVPFAPVAPVAPALPMPSQHADDEEQSDETVAIAISDADVDAATVDQPAEAEPDDTGNPTHPHRD
jgi:hypothetical protein